MSTDYSIYCQDCGVAIHLGQRFANGHFIFGFGSTDDVGRHVTGEFIMAHTEHAPLIVCESDRVPDGVKEAID